VTHYSWELCQDPLRRAAQVAEALGGDACAAGKRIERTRVVAQA
jgi:hypothetical protein